MIKVKEFLSQIYSHNVNFIIIDGMAAISHGSKSLITADIDICYARDKENLEKIVKAISPFHPYLRGAPKNLPFIFDFKTLQAGLNFTPLHPEIKKTSSKMPRPSALAPNPVLNLIHGLIQERGVTGFTFSTDIGDIDLIGEIQGVGYYSDTLKYSEKMEIYEMQCHVLTIEGLIKSKKAAGRPKDEPVIKELEALLEIRKQKGKNR
ncbi:MAG: hypothetical protein HY097_04285 [Nitrospinae bacterium]|nr:hypothetical protein [Nitrospinota bacterium]MBI3815325.1 hypothetical protein [Nitrospinota bacterium]